ncbi:hypothetical protein [Variovorax sp. PBL-E5]|uniref:hypothetical protein n=1 Tax=Variovorax sp. PBL-E5 TaxID=434014 RepID=UPI00131659FE|nr:hypothetical protein [Variovorax sp. PBL-E5]VTU39219.1 hypothetical protein E5CHR_05024 [Variovorax sp. PBL-E5]
MIRFVRKADFGSLSLQDLLDARDHYHVHLANLPTVTGTAVGRYRIRLNDRNIDDASLSTAAPDKALGPRTLRGSDIRPWSWPSVLVFVSEWVDPDTLARHPDLTVPPILYLPDGRQVRTCVVLVERRVANLPAAETVVFAAHRVGPGFQVYSQDQGFTRLGVASAVVSDGASAYALISRHLASGAEGPVFALPRGRRVDLGQTRLGARDAPSLSELYPGFAGRDARLTVDASLVKLDNVAAWTSQYMGVGRMGEPIDLSTDTMTLNLIGCPVFTELPGGHRVEGSVQGLFYRHATMGGVDSLAEFLIGPRHPEDSVATRPGDSGSMWFWDHVADGSAAGTAGGRGTLEYRPLAVQWGGQGFLANPGSASTEFALATSLSAICKSLRVELVRDWESDQSRYWGKVGHYHIGYAACFALRSDKARALFEANASSIGVSDADIVAGKLPSATQTSKFIALADVPDLVWRRTRGKDKANHFADMDEPGKGPFAGKTLLSLWKSDKSSRTPKVWNDFYGSIDPKRKAENRGALPFRVAQLYGIMVDAVHRGALDEFVCAAGVLAHYSGDACQPLHVSYLHHGLPGDASDDGVHAVYEDDMLDQAAAELVAGVSVRVAKAPKRAAFKGSAAAADAVVQLMRRTIAKLPPADIVDCYDRVRGKGQAKAMWTELGARTMDCIADGVLTLATIWQSAWTEGGGDAGQQVSLKAARTPVPTANLKKLYDTKTFAESKWLSEM